MKQPYHTRLHQTLGQANFDLRRNGSWLARTYRVANAQPLAIGSMRSSETRITKLPE
jgi:hypothetical protein